MFYLHRLNEVKEAHEYGLTGRFAIVGPAHGQGEKKALLELEKSLTPPSFSRAVVDPGQNPLVFNSAAQEFLLDEDSLRRRIENNPTQSPVSAAALKSLESCYDHR